MKFRRRWMLLVALWTLVLCSPSALGKTLRIVYYNTECVGKGTDVAITGGSHSLPTIIQAIGLHHIGTNAQQVDVLAVEELQSTTLSNFVTQLNAIYGSGTYAFDPTTDLTTGGGTDGIIYNTHTVQVVSARTTKTGQTVLLQPNGTTYTAAHSAFGGTNGITRAPMVYQLRPIGSTAADDFYMYVSHARSTSDNAQGDARYAEAQCVRSDAKYKLPAGAHIIYGGDWNLFSGSEENAYKCLTGQTTSDGINWADTSAVWTNTNPTQAYDPLSKTSPPTTFTWSNSATDVGTYFYTDSTTNTDQYTMSSRIDIQLVNGPMLAAYNNQGGVQLAPDTGDPFDTSNFPSSKYPYAFKTFGNNGTTPRGSPPTYSGNHSLDDLLNTTPNAATVYADLVDTNTSGSDHYPIVGDYNVVPKPAPVIVLTPQGVQANGRFQLRLSSTPSTAFGIQSSPDLTTWTNIGSGTTDTTGALIFQDANTPNPDHRFYRAYWPFP